MNTATMDVSRPLVPIKDSTQTPTTLYDHSKDGWNLDRLLRLVSDCSDQPLWRVRADVAAAYVDGKQFTPEQMAAAIAEGMPNARPTNLIGRVIRSVCGQEAKARTDVKVEVDDDETADVGDVLNGRLKEAQRETFADMAVSNAYFGQTGPGIGWVEVALNANPLEYRYRVKDIHRSDMWWDWRAKDLLLRDARWIARIRWQDLDELQAAMPQHAKLLEQVSNGWSGFIFDQVIDESGIQLANAWRDQDRWRTYRRSMEWFDGARKRVKLFEVWYKVPAWGILLHFSPTRVVLFDQTNQSHIEAVASGTVKVTRELTDQVRMALFAGPHRLADIGTTKRDFPYVPFIAYRDDEDLSPYGLVEGMISPQDEYNARRLRINWMLRARQIQMDSDALEGKANTLENIAAAVMRPDLTVVLNPNRKYQDAFRIGTDVQLQKEQVEVMQDAKQLIQDVPGVYGSQLGQAASGVTSGIANSLLIEQGAVAMGDLNDNYRHSRRAVFERLLDLIIDDHSKAGMKVPIGRGSSRRAVVLNMWDPQAMVMVNSVKDAAARVGLGEVPSTPAFRMQQQQQIATIINAIAQAAPQAAGVLVPSFIEASDLHDRIERADDARRAMGMPTAGDRQAAQAQQAQQEAQAKRDAQIKDEAMQLELAGKKAIIDKDHSVAKLNEAKVVEIGHGLAAGHLDRATQERQAQEANQPDPEAERQRLIDESIMEAKQLMAA
jgi:hypothetical protein